jgi:L-ascorbate metabolism protein UlaG (beta-lactamase superfamily)
MIRITYLSHSCFLIEGEGSRLIIDPFLEGNPNAPMRAREVKADFVLATHGHPDHLGDSVEIANGNDATLVAPFELGLFCERKGARKVHTMHIGGRHSFPFGSVKLTPALHGSGYPDEQGMTYTGNPCGFLIGISGKTLYHAGDTGLMADMKLIGELNRIDVAMLPIGDNYTMGEEDALHAARFLNSSMVIPMHFGTFPELVPGPETFQSKAAAAGIAVRVLGFGETLELQ